MSHSIQAEVSITSISNGPRDRGSCRCRRPWRVVKRVSSPPIGALTDCFSAIRGGQFSALNNREAWEDACDAVDEWIDREGMLEGLTDPGAANRWKAVGPAGEDEP